MELIGPIKIMNLLVPLALPEIQSLPLKMRGVFLLSREENLSHKEIAEQLGISEQTVSKQISNALKALRYKMRVSVFAFFFSYLNVLRRSTGLLSQHQLLQQAILSGAL